jgi:hypothetical protein
VLNYIDMDSFTKMGVGNPYVALTWGRNRPYEDPRILMNVVVRSIEGASLLSHFTLKIKPEGIKCIENIQCDA